jgi:hypothetical protein
MESGTLDGNWFYCNCVEKILGLMLFYSSESWKLVALHPDQRNITRLVTSIRNTSTGEVLFLTIGSGHVTVKQGEYLSMAFDSDNVGGFNINSEHYGGNNCSTLSLLWVIYRIFGIDASVASNIILTEKETVWRTINGILQIIQRLDDFPNPLIESKGEEPVSESKEEIYREETVSDSKKENDPFSGDSKNSPDEGKTVSKEENKPFPGYERIREMFNPDEKRCNYHPSPTGPRQHYEILAAFLLDRGTEIKNMKSYINDLLVMYRLTMSEYSLTSESVFVCLFIALLVVNKQYYYEYDLEDSDIRRQIANVVHKLWGTFDVLNESTREFVYDTNTYYTLRKIATPLWSPPVASSNHEPDSESWLPNITGVTPLWSPPVESSNQEPESGDEEWGELG